MRTGAGMRMLWCAGVLAALAGGASARQGGPESDPQALLTALDDERFDVREAATRRMGDSAVFPDALLMELAQREGLSVEQRSRLVEVLKRRFEASPRGAVGIQFAMAPGYAIVGQTYPGYPAVQRDVIRAGDIFLEIGGFKLTPEAGAEGFAEPLLDRMRAVIFSHDPGESVPAVILRPKARAGANGVAGRMDPRIGMMPVDLDEIEGEKLTVQVPLGRFTDMAGAGRGLDAETLARAWALRAGRLGLRTVLVGEALGTGLGDEEWLRHGRVRFSPPGPQAVFAGPTRVEEEFSDALRRGGQDFDLPLQQRVGPGRFVVGGNRRWVPVDEAAARGGGGAPVVQIIAEDPQTRLSVTPSDGARTEELSAKVARLERLRVSLADTERRAAAAKEPAMRRALEEAAVEMRMWVDELADEVDRELMRVENAAP